MKHKKQNAKLHKDTDSQECSCGVGSYLTCCALLLKDGINAVNPEQLMRSRYTAYVLGDVSYLRKTWHPDFCPTELTHDAAIHWLGLAIKASSACDLTGKVEFIARYKIAGRAYKMHEISDFVFEHGRWFYTTGLILEG